MGAWEQLYRAHADALLLRVIRPRVGSHADAEDVLVDTFVTALTRLEQFKWTDRGLFPWLARIASNKAHDLGRRAGRDQRRESALMAEPDAVVETPDELLAQKSSRQEAVAQVDAVMEELNPRYTQALQLRLLEGRSRAECAEELDVKLGTFDVLLLRATRAFRARFDTLFGGDDDG